MTAPETRSVALRCEDVTVKYGAFLAVNRVSLSFEKGRLYSIIGPNGAGKTTLINAFSGWQSLASGRVFMGEEEITSAGPHVRARKGMGRSFQIVQIFPALTVFENLRQAAQARHFSLQPFWRPVRSYPALREASEEMLGVIGLERQRDTPAATLSHGDQRRLEVGISLMNDPSIVLLDEPMAGVGHHEVEHMVSLIGSVARGRTVILIEHNMDVVLSISDVVVVMVGGQVMCRGAPSEIRASRSVREAYLGEEVDEHALA
jgi:branched-chain amino acid transport system ATP-binding protein